MVRILPVQRISDNMLGPTRGPDETEAPVSP